MIIPLTEIVSDQPLLSDDYQFSLKKLLLLIPANTLKKLK